MREAVESLQGLQSPCLARPARQLQDQQPDPAAGPSPPTVQMEWPRPLALALSWEEGYLSVCRGWSQAALSGECRWMSCMPTRRLAERLCGGEGRSEEAELTKVPGCSRPHRLRMEGQEHLLIPKPLAGFWRRDRGSGFALGPWSLALPSPSGPMAVTGLSTSPSGTGAVITRSRTTAAGSASAATSPMPRTTPWSSPTTSPWQGATCGGTPCTRCLLHARHSRGVAVIGVTECMWDPTFGAARDTGVRAFPGASNRRCSELAPADLSWAFTVGRGMEGGAWRVEGGA